MRTRAERTKQEEVRGKRRGGAAGAGGGGASAPPGAAGGATPRPNKKGSKKEKLLCICRTPYDNTKLVLTIFYHLFDIGLIN